MDLSSILDMDSIMNVATDILDKIATSTGLVDQIISSVKRYWLNSVKPILVFQNNYKDGFLKTSHKS